MVKRSGLAILVFCLITTWISTAPARMKEHKLPDHPEKGIRVFKEKNCIACHSVWDVGGKIGPDLAKTIKGKSFYQIIGLFWNHSSRMFAKMKEEKISFQTMSAEDVEHLTAFLYYLNFFDAPGDYEKGRIAFKEKNCIVCHSLGEDTLTPGRSLDKFGWMISPVYLGTHMWNHRSKMKSMFKQKNLSFPEFNDRDIADILAYIRGSSVGETENRKYLQPGNPNSGKTIFEEKKCTTCHQIFGNDTGSAPDLGETQLAKSITELTAIQWNHLDKMEEMYKELGLTLPKFEPQEMVDLLTYIYFIHFYDREGDASNGELIFTEKGCVQCHSVSDNNDGNTINLAFSSIKFGSFEFAARMWNHTERMGEIFSSELISWPIFRDDEMRDLISYLQSKSEN